jgi:hypothetical protein
MKKGEINIISIELNEEDLGCVVIVDTKMNESEKKDFREVVRAELNTPILDENIKILTDKEFIKRIFKK